MECQNYREQFSQLLSDTLNQTDRRKVEAHLATCADCRREFEEVQKLWNLMGEVHVPEPSEKLRSEFNTALSEYKEKMVVKSNPLEVLISRLRESWELQFRPRVVYGILFIAVGLIAGYMLHRPGETALSYNKQIDSLSSQVSEMRQLMMLSLLQNPSASQRIRAVSYTDEISNADNKVIDALFTTLNEDPNVNVRLATLDALAKYSDKPEVRAGLVRSISLQESPLMQTAIADLMVKLREKSSVPSLQELLKKKDLNKMVKINLQKNINKLI
jgi:hypothetical protein